MIYKLSEINREVELEDSLVDLYTKLDELHESIFLIPIYSTLDHKKKEIEESGKTAEDYLTDQELSQICNKAIVKELQMYSLLPEIVKRLDIIKEKLMGDTPIEMELDGNLS